jgi:hypothetical protein
MAATARREERADTARIALARPEMAARVETPDAAVKAATVALAAPAAPAGMVEASS